MRDISIHAPRTGSDGPPGRTTALRSDFNPRSPHGERRRRTVEEDEEEYFNPRSPHGERLPGWREHLRRRGFQSTLPARGATGRNGENAVGGRHFNPRSPHGERRESLTRLTRAGSDFNPRSPHGERHDSADWFPPKAISIHAPRTGSDSLFRRALRVVPISIHAPRTGSDSAASVSTFASNVFQSTLPARGATSTRCDTPI